MSSYDVRLLIIFCLVLSMVSFGAVNSVNLIRPVHATYLCGLPGYPTCSLAQNNGNVCANSACNPNNQWVPAGPMVDKILVNVYADQNGEFTALQGNALDLTDWTLSQGNAPTTCTSGSTAIACDTRFYVNDAQGTDQIANYGMFGIDFNNANTFWGINFGYGKDTNPQASQALDIRQAVAHLIDRQAFISSEFGTLAQAMDNPIPPGQNYVHSGLPTATDVSVQSGGSVGGPYCINESTAATHTGICSAAEYSIKGACSWDTLDATFRAAGQTCSSAYHYGAGEATTNGIVNVGTVDFCDAARHFVHAGLATGFTAGTCTLTSFAPVNGGAASITFLVESGDPVLTNLGNGVAADLCQLIAATNTCTQVSTGIIQIRDVWQIVHATDTVHLDWHMYTARSSTLGPTPEQVWKLYDSQFASNACGGTFGPHTANYIYFCNTNFDHYANMVEYNATTAGSIAALQMGLDIFGSHLPSIPVYAQNDVFAYRTEWTGTVFQKGIGLTDPMTTLNMWSPTPAASGEVRWGWRQGTTNPNPIGYTNQWEIQWSSNIYDTLVNVNPYSPTDIFGWMVNQWQILGPQPGDPSGTVQDIKFNLRNDIFFHDGKQLTANDIMFSWQAYANTGGQENPLTLGIAGIRIQNDFNFIMNTNSLSVYQLSNIGGFPILPQHLLAADTTTKCTTPGTAPCSLASCATCPSGFVDTADLVQSHQFIGTGPYKCVDIVTGQIGGGCSNTGTGSTTQGNTIILTRNGYGLAGTANAAYFRDSAKFKQWEWADLFQHGTVDITDVSAAAACLGKAASSSINCTNLDRPAATITCIPAAGSCNSQSMMGLGGNNDGTVEFIEIQQAFRWFGVSWNSPLTYAQLSNTTGCGGTGCGAQSVSTQTVYEGGIQYAP